MSLQSTKQIQGAASRTSRDSLLLLLRSQVKLSNHLKPPQSLICDTSQMDHGDGDENY